MKSSDFVLGLVVFFLALFVLSPKVSEARVAQICPGYKIDSPKKISFNANEKKLFCGDPDTSAWREIPRFQGEYFIKTFLQDRGYFSPEFSEQEDFVVVHPGPQARVKQIEVVGSPPFFFDVTRRRKIKGAVLTPSLLNTLEKWTKAVLEENGYPCPNVQTKADPATGVVSLNVTSSPLQRIIDVTEEPVEGLRPGTLSRYRAFRIGDPYNGKNLTLTSHRIENVDSLLQSSYFLTECADEGAELTQKSTLGPTWLIRVGLGANSEDYFIAKLNLKEVRFGLNGSSAELAVRATFREQRFQAQADLYPLPYPSRWYLNPMTGTARYDETPYEYVTFDVLFPAAFQWDTRNIGHRIRFGPRFNLTRTERGAEEGTTDFITGNVRLDVISHDYQYEPFDPQRGFFFNVAADFASNSLGSSVTAQKIKVTGQSLWNIAGFDPPLFVVAIRGLVGTTLTDRGAADFPQLPPSFFYYLGGSQSLRGFNRLELPQADRGGLTTIYTGAEGRLAHLLPLNIQPIAFVDFGVLGQRSLDLDFPVFWSPGTGVRWPSPIGVFRFTAAHGLMIHNNNPANQGLEGWQYYFSYGEEF